MATERNREFFEEARETRNGILNKSLSEFTVGDLAALLGILGLREGITRGFHPSVEDLQTIKERLQNPLTEESEPQTQK